MRKKRDKRLVIFILFLGFCWLKQLSFAQDIPSIASEYYQTYQIHQNFGKFMSFYDDEAVLEDIIFGVKIEGKNNLSDFFNWNISEFEILDSVALVIESQIIQQNQVVSSGYFTKFNFQGTEVEAMYFTTILTFNDAGKIIKQVDWINYPSDLASYDVRQNSNSWIKLNED